MYLNCAHLVSFFVGTTITGNQPVFCGFSSAIIERKKKWKRVACDYRT